MAKASSSASPDHSHSDESGNQGGGDRDNSNVREQDRFLPIANIGRIMKRKLPAQAKIAKDSKETVQECVSELISFITGEANAKCQIEKRKTINGDDLLWAMSNTGFDNYVEPLKVYLHKYREIEGAKVSGMNTPGDQASGKKEGGGPPMSPGVQMGLGGAFGGGIPDMAPISSRVPDMPPMSPRGQMGPGGVYDGGMPSMQPDRYQMQMSQQMLEALGNQQLVNLIVELQDTE